MNLQAVLEIGVCGLLLAANAWLFFGHRQKMGAEKGDKPQDRYYTRSAEVIVFGLVLVVQAFGFYRRARISLGSWAPESLFERTLDYLPLPADAATFAIGLALYAAGFGLRIWAIRTLGRFFTFQVGIREGHRIVQDGPYRWLRHPSYTGFIVALLGTSVVHASLFGIILVILGPTVFLLARIADEEGVLRKHFGPAFDEYRARTKRLIPFIY